MRLAILADIHDTGYLTAKGAMGRLFLRELITASQQIVHFLRLYAQWSKQESMPLAEVLECFLNSF